MSKRREREGGRNCHEPIVSSFICAWKVEGRRKEGDTAMNHVALSLIGRAGGRIKGLGGIEGDIFSGLRMQ